MAEDWRQEGACWDTDPDVFFPVREEDVGAALAICATCPVQSECLTYALRNEGVGIWGGTTESERRKLRRRYRIKLQPRQGLPRGRRDTEPNEAVTLSESA